MSCIHGRDVLIREDDEATLALTLPIESTGPITRARAKKLQQQVTLFFKEYNFDENLLLPNSSVLCVLRYEDELTHEGPAKNSRQRRSDRPDCFP